MKAKHLVLSAGVLATVLVFGVDRVWAQGHGGHGGGGHSGGGHGGGHASGGGHAGGGHAGSGHASSHVCR